MKRRPLKPAAKGKKPAAQAKKPAASRAKPAASRGKPAAKGKKPVAPPPEPAAPAIPDIPSTLEILRTKSFAVEPSEEIILAICHLIKQGSTAETASRAMAIPRPIFRRWVEKGLLEIEDPSSIYAKLIIAIDSAEATDEYSDILSITLGTKHWAALAWKRERKTPSRWGPRPTLSLDLDVLSPQAAPPQISDDDAAMIFAILEQCGGVPKNSAPSEESAT